jgi:hypothetical protein
LPICEGWRLISASMASSLGTASFTLITSTNGKCIQFLSTTGPAARC